MTPAQPRQITSGLSLVRRFRTPQEAHQALRDYHDVVSPIVRELVEIEMYALPTYTLHADGHMEVGPVRYPPSMAEAKQTLLDELARWRVYFGFEAR